MKKLFVLGLVFVLTTLSVSAQSHRATERFRRHRVEQGVRSGQINRFEMRHLRHDQRRLNLAKRRARRDGTVTRFERRRLFAMKRDERHDIFRFRHNSRRRYI
jgi:hypothetical protein